VLRDAVLDGPAGASATHLWRCGVRRRCCSNASHAVRVRLRNTRGATARSSRGRCSSRASRWWSPRPRLRRHPPAQRPVGTPAGNLQFACGINLPQFRRTPRGSHGASSPLRPYAGQSGRPTLPAMRVVRPMPMAGYSPTAWPPAIPTRPDQELRYRAAAGA
jgi:hypothetical protein